MPTVDQPVLTLAAEGGGLFLVSFWKPVLYLLVFLPWAWVVTKVYDKHAAQFFLPRQRWNTVHMIAGTLAILVALLIPLKGEAAFWVGLAAMIAILGADLAAYAIVANRDERVPEKYRIRLSMESLAEARAAKAKAKLQARVSLVIRGPDKQVVAAPAPETPEYEVRVAAEDLYLKSLLARASQTDIAPTGKDNTYAATVLVDGVRQALEGGVMPLATAVKVMDFWKAAAKLDVSDRRRLLKGDVTVEKDGAKHVVRVTSAGVQGGMRLTLAYDPEAAVIRQVTELGLLDVQMAELKGLVAEEQGVVLVASPPDGGRTTTSYAIVRMHDAYTTNVQTVEIDPQASLEGVRTNRYEPEKEGAEFSTLVRSVLRRDPKVVLVADLPDANTAKEIARADHERTRIYVGLRADSAMAAIETWVRAVGDPKQAAGALRGALAEKLLRKLCPNCRTAYPPPADMLKKLGLPADKVKQLYKKGGQVLIKDKPAVCPMCQGVGYLGQEGIFEVYRLAQEDRALIASGDLAGLRASLRKKQQPTMQQAAIRKAIDGITSVEEVMRVTASPAAAGAPGGASAAARPAGTPSAAPAVAPAPAKP
jgi:type II secretory ATPase GspE/PulE/Tfp pilus assembly ATPase PilB-like protein